MLCLQAQVLPYTPSRGSRCLDPKEEYYEESVHKCCRLCGPGHFCSSTVSEKCYHCQPYRKCEIGHGVVQEGTRETDVECAPCQPGTFSDHESDRKVCTRHRICQPVLIPGNSSHDTVCGNPGGRVNPGTTSPPLTTVTKRPPLRAGTERPIFNDQDPSADTGKIVGMTAIPLVLLVLIGFVAFRKSGQKCLPMWEKKKQPFLPAEKFPGKWPQVPEAVGQEKYSLLQTSPSGLWDGPAGSEKSQESSNGDPHRVETDSVQQGSFPLNDGPCCSTVDSIVMLEGLIAWVLNTYLGKYVSNLNTDQLSVALLKGAVELENLPLKKDALKEVLPFEVKAGFVGKITLKIPFYRPHIDPWVISVSKLYLIGSPEKQEDFVEARERLLDQENKKAFLLALEEKWKVEELMKKKQLDISDFSIYWDSSCSLCGDSLPGELQEAMDNSMENRDHKYIVEPVCTSALLKRNCSKEPLRSRNRPRLEFDIQLETIPLKLSQMQYRQIMDFLKELERKERQLKFRKWRPKVTVTGKYEFFLFVYEIACHLRGF
ncbi:hypothetical protein Chor_005598 [Crotalus horridus]